MEIKRFGLGIRFDMLSDTLDRHTAKSIFEEIFSVLTAGDVSGLAIHAGIDDVTSTDKGIYIVVISGGTLSRMRKIFRKLDDDAGIGMYLAATRPFIENNRLVHLEGLTYYGQVERSGRIAGGDEDCFGLTVPQKRGRKRPVGRGIKILLAPDSFKGTISSTEAIKRLTIAARRHFPGAKIVPVPISDGGEGTVHALVTACDGAIHRAVITGPLGAAHEARYGVIYGRTAVIEMAEASGLCLIPEAERNIMAASSFGTGELIRRALDEGLRDFIIGIGGSATNDCGMGCARALGIKFYDEAGVELMGSGAELARVAKIDTEYLYPRIKDAKFTLMCDVTNPLLGPDGATAVYGPQKGARAEQLKALESGMESFIGLLETAFNISALRDMPGAGAAGGVGAMLIALLSPTVRPGIDAMLDAVDFEKLLRGVALVVTGEGRLDAQSVHYGKAVAGIMRRCAARGVPVAIITGGMGEGADEIFTLGNAGIMPTVREAIPLSDALENAAELFDSAADRMFRFIRMGRDVEKIGAPKKPNPGSLNALPIVLDEE